MKQTSNMRRQLAINLKYCYSARRATQNMSASRRLPTIYSRSRPVTSMGHQGAKSFVRVAEIFKLCPKHFPEWGDFAGVFAPPGC